MLVADLHETLQNIDTFLLLTQTQLKIDLESLFFQYVSKIFDYIQQKDLTVPLIFQ